VIRQICSRTSISTRRRILEQADRRRYGNFAVGIEVLPTEIVAVLTDPTGYNYGQRRRGLANMKVESVVREIDVVARDLVTTHLGIDLPSSRIAIGLQIGGPVDARAGLVLSWANHPTDPAFAVDPDEWREPVRLAALVEEGTGCRTVVENDAAAYAVYEQRFGVGYQTGSFAVVLVRDGVGGGIVLDHRVISIPFEIGHLTVQPDGRPCPCGNNGCIESLAGRRAIRGIVGKLLGGKTDTDGIKQAIDLADDGHEKSKEVLTAFREGGEAIARGVATILTLFGVSHVVVYCDRAMSEAESTRPAVAAFFAGLNTFGKYTFPTFKTCQLVLKQWRSTDGALGAALVALNQLFFVPLADLELPT
jgi:predicted NBD/HSP70 family sugar kinase